MARIRKPAIAVAAATLSAACWAMPAAHADARANGARVAATFEGVFTYHACPAGSAPGDFCLSDTLTGATLPGLGPAVGHFEVDIHYGEFGGADCGPIDKHGDFTAADGATVHLVAVGSLCKTPGTAQYAYVVTGGTGRLRHAYGAGEWQIPVADAYVDGGGWGKEILTGTLHP